jgi:hypothetical protein
MRQVPEGIHLLMWLTLAGCLAWNAWRSGAIRLAITTRDTGLTDRYFIAHLRHGMCFASRQVTHGFGFPGDREVFKLKNDNQ